MSFEVEGWGFGGLGDKNSEHRFRPLSGRGTKSKGKGKNGILFFEKHNVVIASKSRALQDSAMYFMV